MQDNSPRGRETAGKALQSRWAVNSTQETRHAIRRETPDREAHFLERPNKVRPSKIQGAVRDPKEDGPALSRLPHGGIVGLASIGTAKSIRLFLTAGCAKDLEVKLQAAHEVNSKKVKQCDACPRCGFPTPGAVKSAATAIIQDAETGRCDGRPKRTADSDRGHRCRARDTQGANKSGHD